MDGTITRIRIIDDMGNKSYIVINNRKVSHFGANEQPFALSCMCGNNAAELRFALEDADEVDEIMDYLELYGYKTNKYELL